ncbi:MAG: DUF4115 domain-containing protein [candidate division KSB1 bacterium]|nr:DUF4115 domain-containing protein [candidate division KSB1 bacterium]MDZ7300870.1 DUF4115 domain-containing protein [candidate division KSB1 bacterium]MDZ7309860.1 DUF4115 domain-containing protein [candidate division KSB1 bacterium]
MSVERLQEILLENDRARMKALEEELEKVRTNIEDKEALIASLNPVIADLLERKIASSGEEMAEIVAPLMGPAIKKQVAESRDEVVEALYPVIGQAVRRAVAEAMRKLIKQINERLDKSFNLKITWLRLKARIMGLPEPLVVIPQVFPFIIEQLFLIDQRTGLLVAHASAEHPVGANGKPQMISGMLTAIQDFVKDAFGSKAEGDLHEVKYGDKMIFVASSPPVFLAAVTQGAAPLHFPDRLRAVLRRIHNTWHRQLREFDGDATALEGVREPMRKFIVSFSEPAAVATKTQRPKRSSRLKSTFAKIAFGVILGFALAAGIWFLFKLWGGQEIPPAGAPFATLTPGASQLRLEARLSGQVWIRAVTDEKDSTDFMFQPGEVHAWRADRRIRIRVGNAGQTELFLNGKNLGPLGDLHQAVTLIITPAGIVERRSSLY